MKEIGTTKIGLTYKPTDVCNCGIPVLRSNNIKEDKLNLNELIYVNCNINDNLLVKDNDILICARNGSKHLVGKAALIKKNKSKMTFGAFMSIFRSCCNNYVFRFLNSNYFRTTMANANSTQINQLTQDMIKETLCPLPPLAEQARISSTVQKLLEIVETLENDKIDLSELIKQTKAKVLDLAIKGKLVPQNPEDEPADILLEKIREEKENLIKEGKLKRDKNETFIFKNSDDNSYYEQINGETVCIDDDLPFEIPDTWRWCKLRNIGQYKKGPFGSALTKAIFVPKSDNTIKVYEQKNAIQKDASLGAYYITNEYYESNMKGFTVHPGEIIVSCAGTIGETYILPTNIEKGIINQALMKISLTDYINIDYFLNYFDFILKREAIENSQGTAIKNIPPFDILKEMYIAIPPLSEQYRIVEKIKSIFNQLDTMQEIFLQ